MHNNHHLIQKVHSEIWACDFKPALNQVLVDFECS